MAKKRIGDYTVAVDPGSVSKTQKLLIKSLKKRVFGQDRALRRAVRAISVFEAGVNDPQKPVGSLLFAGPSGVGKTFMAKQLAYAWIGEPEAGLDPVVFIDCGSLSLEHERAVLTGAPPGYVGDKDGSILEQIGEYEKTKNYPDKTEILKKWMEERGAELAKMGVPFESVVGQMPGLRKFFLETTIKNEKQEARRPFRSVVIFDEIEKANMNVQKQLLSILEEGKLRLQSGVVVDFTGSLIIFTTNVGTRQILSEYLSGEQIGFKNLSATGTKNEISNMDQVIWMRVRREIECGKYFLPEFLGRIGSSGIIVFQTLKAEHYLKIFETEFLKLQKRFSAEYEFSPGILSITYTKSFRDFILTKSINPKYGARVVSDTIKKYATEPLANAILSGELKQNDRVLLDIGYKTIEGRKDSRTLIFRQKRSSGSGYPPFKFEGEIGPAFSADEMIEMLDKELKEVLGREF